MPYYNKPRYRNYEFAESMRDSVTESGANTYTSEEIKTPVGRSNNQALAIFGAVHEFSGFDTPAQGDKLEWQLTKNAKTEIINVANTDLIMKRAIEFALVTSGMAAVELVKHLWFPRPKIYANSSMFTAMKSTGQAGANSSHVEIIYVLRSVHPIIMNRALTD